MTDNRQRDFSERYRHVYYDEAGRSQKAGKTLAILREELGDLSARCAVDVGCSTGFIAKRLSEHFAEVLGIDIDSTAIAYAREKLASPNLTFQIGDAMATGLADACCDVVVCAQVYEHVPDADRMIAEIQRILRPGGACFFSAANRLMWADGEYGLPLASWLPPRLADTYVRAAGKGDRYDERFRTYWNLRRLVAAFDVHDYTERVVTDPVRYAATDVIRPNSLAQRAAIHLLHRAYWLFPGYIWVLRRR